MALPVSGQRSSCEVQEHLANAVVSGSPHTVLLLTDKEIEAQRGKVLPQGHTVSQKLARGQCIVI